MTTHQHGKFEWDPAKARSNRLKHRVSFEEGISTFNDPSATIELDVDHSTPDETRWVITGLSARLRILTIVFTIRSYDDEGEKEFFRIISVRRATAPEKARYPACPDDDGRGP